MARSYRTNLALRLGTIFWLLGAVGLTLALPILSQMWWAIPLLVVILAILAAGPMAWLWRRFVVAGRLRNAWLPLAIACTMGLAVVIAPPIYYFAGITRISPALVPLVTMTNGDKRIVFQGMQHVGAARFYKLVAFDLEEALGRGYVLYYEGVSNSNPADDRWFADIATHGQDLASSYRALGEVCGLDFQSDYLQVVVNDSVLHPNNHVVADVSTSQLRGEFDRLMRTDPVFAAAMAGPVDRDQEDDGLERLVGWLRRGTQGQRDLAGIICREIMTRAMSQSNDAAGRQDPDPLILDHRNQILARRLLAEPRRNIYVTYGAKHLPGTFALLKAADPRWRVASVKWARTIDSPESYSASLPGITGL